MIEPKHNPPAQAAFGTPEVLLGSTEEATTATSSVKTSGKSGRFAVGGVVAALAVGGAFAAQSAFVAPAGPGSPTEAIDQFFEAMDQDDLVGIAAVVHPAERESLAGPMFDMVDHAQRLEIIEADAGDATSPFADFQVDGITYSIEETGPRLAYVVTTGGTLTVPPSSFPAGALFDHFDIDIPEAEGETTVADLGEESMKVAVVEDDGSWYVSLWYSAAEDIRRNEGLAFPGLGSGPAPVGAATPDAVLEDFARAAADLDAEAMLTLLDPEEAGALYDYSDLYLADAQAGLDDIKAEASAEGITWSLDLVDFTATESNGRQIVSGLNGFEASFTQERGGEVNAGSVKVVGDCTTVDLFGEITESCTSEPSPETEQFTADIYEILDLSETTRNTLTKLSGVETGLTVVERDGRWYLSLVPSYIEIVNDYLTVLEPEDLVAVGTDIEELVEDADRVIEDVMDLISNTDFETMQSGTASMGALPVAAAAASSVAAVTVLGSTAETQFVGVSESITPELSEESLELLEIDPELLEQLEELDPIVVDEPEQSGILDVDPELAGLLIELDSGYAVGAQDLFLSWSADSEAPDFASIESTFIRGAYGFTDESFIELAEFSAPVAPGVLDSTFELSTNDVGVTYATNGESTFAFVGNYVVLSFGEDLTVLEAQIAKLP